MRVQRADACTGRRNTIGGADRHFRCERFGAGERAPVELSSARRKLQEAREADRAGRHDEAERLAREAQVDAQLASMKAQSSAAQTALTQVREGITTLQGETQRQPAR